MSVDPAIFYRPWTSPPFLPPWANQPTGVVPPWMDGITGMPLPLSAGPQLAPQGFFGDLLGQLGGPAGGILGGLLGNAGLGQQIGNTVGGFAHLLPFSAGPQLAVAGSEPEGEAAKIAQKPILLPRDAVGPEAQAGLNMVHAATNGYITGLVDYLTANTAQKDLLGDALALTQRADEFSRANDYQRALLQAQLAYRSIEALRARHPELPAVFAQK